MLVEGGRCYPSCEQVWLKRKSCIADSPSGRRILLQRDLWTFFHGYQKGQIWVKECPRGATCSCLRSAQVPDSTWICTCITTLRRRNNRIFCLSKMACHGGVSAPQNECSNKVSPQFLEHTAECKLPPWTTEKQNSTWATSFPTRGTLFLLDIAHNGFRFRCSESKYRLSWDREVVKEYFSFSWLFWNSWSWPACSPTLDSTPDW